MYNVYHNTIVSPYKTKIYLAESHENIKDSSDLYLPKVYVCVCLYM